MNKVLNFVAAALGKRQAKPAQWPVDHGQPIAAASGGGQGRPELVRVAREAGRLDGRARCRTLVADREPYRVARTYCPVHGGFAASSPIRLKRMLATNPRAARAAGRG